MAQEVDGDFGGCRVVIIQGCENLRQGRL